MRRIGVIKSFVGFFDKIGIKSKNGNAEYFGGFVAIVRITEICGFLLCALLQFKNARKIVFKRSRFLSFFLSFARKNKRGYVFGILRFIESVRKCFIENVERVVRYRVIIYRAVFQRRVYFFLNNRVFDGVFRCADIAAAAYKHYACKHKAYRKRNYRPHHAVCLTRLSE